MLRRDYYGNDQEYNNRGRQVQPYGAASVQAFGFGDMLPDFDRQFRHMNRDLHHLERQLSRGDRGLASMVDRAIPIEPQFVDENGRKVARFHFDVSGFKPEDVSIKTSEGKVVVTARHEDKGEDHHAVREFKRMVAIPEGMQFEEMRSRLTPNGVLTLEAPYNPPALQHDSHREIPIHHESKKAINQ